MVSKSDETVTFPTGREKNGSAQVSMELLNFLRDWLIHHIQGTDHQYVDSVQRALREEQRA